MIDLDALERLAERRGLPWRHVSAKHVERVDTESGIDVVDARVADWSGQADCALIVAAVNSLPGLIAELREARAVLRRMTYAPGDPPYCRECESAEGEPHAEECRLERVLGST